MATGGLTPLRGNNAYIGYGKQSAWGTPVAPTWFSRWLDGSGFNADAKVTTEMEGDASPWEILAYKTEQKGMVKVVEYARPQSIGYALQAFLGTGSDTFTAPSISTTFSATIVAGATTFSVPVSIGTVGTLALNCTPGYAAANYEVATVDLTTKTGVGPYTYTLAAGAKFRNGHTSGDAITSVSAHVLARTNTTYDPYTLEWALGFQAGGATGQVFRLQDAVCTEIQLTLEAKKPIKIEHTWYGALTKLQAAPSAPTYEGLSIVGLAGGPFAYYQGQGNWLVDGVATGNAVTVRKATLQLKNSTDVSEYVTEGITPAYFSPENIKVTCDAEAIFQNWNQYNEMYFGAQTIATGAGDSYLVGYGSLQTTFVSDPVNSLLLGILNGAYTAMALTPKLDAKGIPQPLKLTALKSTTALNPLLATLNNSYASSY